MPITPGWSRCETVYQWELEVQYGNQYRFSWLCGDDVPQSLVHNMDRATWALGETPPVDAHGFGGRSGPQKILGDVFDHNSVVYRYANGVRVYAFCRTPEEADRVLEVMAEEGLQRGEHGLEVYCMAEIPPNVTLAGEFAKRFDGFSIGSNDLTQLTLGVDRDSELLGELFDERHAAVRHLPAPNAIRTDRSHQ